MFLTCLTLDTCEVNMGIDSQQAEMLKSLSETLLHQTRENRFSQYNLLEEHGQPAPWNGQKSIFMHYTGTLFCF